MSKYSKLPDYVRSCTTQRHSTSVEALDSDMETILLYF